MKPKLNQEKNPTVQINPDYVTNQLFAKVNQLTADGIVKDAYIQQLTSEIAVLKDTLTEKK